VVVAGDGSTYDMALSATSGTLYRNLDYWYICYDNEAYGNTGMQQSSATPYAATATSPGGRRENLLVSGKKDIFEIWRAHRPPYIATVSSASRRPGAEVRKGQAIQGPQIIPGLCPVSHRLAV
jgi:pyruvate ferredoxin oxidoreductase beta subunit